MSLDKDLETFKEPTPSILTSVIFMTVCMLGAIAVGFVLGLGLILLLSWIIF